MSAMDEQERNNDLEESKLEVAVREARETSGGSGDLNAAINEMVPGGQGAMVSPFLKALLPLQLNPVSAP
jgi:hypothetical protein